MKEKVPIWKTEKRSKQTFNIQAMGSWSPRLWTIQKFIVLDWKKNGSAVKSIAVLPEDSNLVP